MITFLLVILCVVLGWKLLKFWLIRKMHNRAQEMFEQFARSAGFDPRQAQSGASERTGSSRAGGWSRKGRKKHFAEADGEYVDYVEVESTTRSQTSTDNSQHTTTYVEEKQVVDVEWEDLPEK